jgi:hypothetical protein
MSDRIRLPDPTPQPQPFFPPGSWVRVRTKLNRDVAFGPPSGAS